MAPAGLRPEAGTAPGTSALAGRSSCELTIKRTPTKTSTSADATRANRAALKLSSSPKRRAPHANAVMMFSGVHDPAARASPMASEARKAE